MDTSSDSYRVAPQRPGFDGARYNAILTNTFKLSAFREQQLEAINSIVEGHDTLVIFPTGAGKSLIYQLAAVYLEKTAVVISPLISLMDDQVTKLRSLGITAFTVSSSTSMNTRLQAYDRMRTNPASISLLYVTPETFRSNDFVTLLQAMVKNNMIGFIAVDECHVLSDWGVTFRSSYRGLTSLRTLFPTIPIVALTATATKYTARDIVTCLRLRNSYRLFIKPFNRQNLYYKIVYIGANSSKISVLLEYLAGYRNHATKAMKLVRQSRNNKGLSKGVVKGDNGSDHGRAQQARARGKYPDELGAVVIYCYTRDETEAVARRLIDEGFNAQYFHAKLAQDAKAQILTDWIKGDADDQSGVNVGPDAIQIIVATIAFGMGIDRSNVRLVIHYNVPRSMEGFYQESGRAGRDSKPALSLVLLNSADASTAVQRVQRDGADFELYSLHSFFAFCLQRRCRRRTLLQYFNSGANERHDDPSWCCDFCSGHSPALSSAYSEMLDGVLSKLSYYTKSKGNEFLGCLQDLVAPGDRRVASSVRSDLAEPTPAKEQDADTSTPREPPIKHGSNPYTSTTNPSESKMLLRQLNPRSEPSQTAKSGRQKYENMFRTHMAKILLHLTTPTLDAKLNEIHRIITEQADNNQSSIEACYKRLCIRLRELTTYPTEDMIYSCMFAYFNYTCV